MKTFSSASQKIGEFGEHIACRYLRERGFTIQERNYTKKWGEIDIIALKGAVTHIIEVKSVSREIFEGSRGEAGNMNSVEPEEQMHAGKRRRLVRIIETYLLCHSTEKWQFDLVCVYIDAQKKQARVKVWEDVVLE